MKSISLPRSIVCLALALAMSAAVLLLAGVAYAQSPSLEERVMTEGQKRQVIQFNPDAALQKRIFADKFVPNSAEFAFQKDGTAYAAQRAENLANGAVRVYYVVVGDWGAVRFAERGATSGDALADTLLAEGEKRQVLQFNPNAALQKRIFADGFVPNSPEFGLQANNAAYATQRAENLANGAVRVYYVKTGDWGNVNAAIRDADGVAKTLASAPAPAPAQGMAVAAGVGRAVGRLMCAGPLTPNHAYSGPYFPRADYGVALSLITGDKFRVAYQTKTGADGRWVINNITPGRYAVSYGGTPSFILFISESDIREVVGGRTTDFGTEERICDTPN